MITRAQERTYRSLKQKKFRTSTGLFLVEGEKCVKELMKSDLTIEAILSSEPGHDRAVKCSQKQINAISALQSPSSVLAVACIPDTPETKRLSGPIFILDSIRDPGNLGTIIRTARWFGGVDMFLSDDCADPYGPKTVQASMGALFFMNIHQGKLEDIVEEIRNSGYKIYATDTKGSSLDSVNLPSNSAIIIGNEGHGIQPHIVDKCDGVLSIDGGNMDGVESLNAAISMGIIANSLHSLRSNGQ